MKITDIKTYPLSTKLEQPFAFSQGWVYNRSAVIVEISTDAGITGWGEAFCQGLQPPQIAAAAIESALKPLIIGANPLDTEVLWHKMYHQTRDYGGKGAVMSAISGVDIALWDIAGKHFGVPIAQLLGGMTRTRVQAYATGFYRIKGQGEAPRLAEEAQAHFGRGFRAMKVKLGFGVEDDIVVMKAVRDALAGKAATLMIDTNHAYGVAEAIQLGKGIEQLGVRLRWYEEPVAQEHITGYREVRKALATPIAGGENEYSLFGYRDFLSQEATDIAQPDIGHCGGFTACKHIIALAHAYGVQVNPHVWGSAVQQAASLQLIAAIPVTHHSLFASEPVLEFDQSSHPFRTDLTDLGLTHQDGWVSIPQKPGLGIELDRKVLEKYRV